MGDMKGKERGEGEKEVGSDGKGEGGGGRRGWKGGRGVVTGFIGSEMTSFVRRKCITK